MCSPSPALRTTHLWILVFGLALSVVLMGVAATFIARLLGKHRWIAYVGLLIIFYVSLHMMWDGGLQVYDCNPTWFGQTRWARTVRSTAPSSAPSRRTEGQKVPDTSRRTIGPKVRWRSSMKSIGLVRRPGWRRADRQQPGRIDFALEVLRAVVEVDRLQAHLHPKQVLFSIATKLIDGAPQFREIWSGRKFA